MKDDRSSADIEAELNENVNRVALVSSEIDSLSDRVAVLTKERDSLVGSYHSTGLIKLLKADLEEAREQSQQMKNEKEIAKTIGSLVVTILVIASCLLTFHPSLMGMSVCVLGTAFGVDRLVR